MTGTVTPLVAREKPLSLALCWLLYGPWLGTAVYWGGRRRPARDTEPNGPSARNVVAFKQGVRSC